MADHDGQEEDQVARVSKELRDGNWLANARNRSKRRKSAWNLLLPLFGLPLWAAFVGLLLRLAQIIHTTFHPLQARPIFAPGPMTVGDTLVSIGAAFAALAPAMLVTNFLVYRIAPARRAMIAEDRKFRGVGYKPAQRALSKFGLWALVFCLPLILIGASLK